MGASVTGRLNWDKSRANDRMARQGTDAANTDGCSWPTADEWRIRKLKRLGRKVRAYEAARAANEGK